LLNSKKKIENKIKFEKKLGELETNFAEHASQIKRKRE